MKLLLLLASLMLAACTSTPQFQPYPRQISHSGAGAYEVSQDVSEQGVAIAWYDDRQGNAEIYLSLYDTNLDPVITEQRLTYSTAQSYEADVAWLGETLAVAWYDIAEDGQSSVHVGLWNNALQPLWQKKLTTSSNGRIPELVSTGKNLFIAWIEERQRPDSDALWSDIRGTWLDPSGEFIHSPFFIASASTTTWNLNAEVLNDSTIALVYDADYATVSSELYLAIAAEDTVSTWQLTADDLVASKYPDIALSDQQAAISWHDEKDGNQEIYLATVDIAQYQEKSSIPGLIDIDTHSTRVTRTPGESIGAYLAWNSDTLGLAWCDNSTGTHDIFFQQFDVNLHAMSSVRQVTDTVADALIPAVNALANGFMLSWNEAYIDGHGTDNNLTTSEIWSHWRDTKTSQQEKVD